MTVPQLAKATLVVPVTGSATTYGANINLPHPTSYDKLVLLAQLKAMDTGTLDVVLQESWDNGTTWDDVAHFPQLPGGSTTPSYRHVVGGDSGTIGNAPTLTVVGTVGTAVPVLAAGAYAPGPWAKTVRIVATTGSGTNSGPQTQTLTWIAVPRVRG